MLFLGEIKDPEYSATLSVYSLDKVEVITSDLICHILNIHKNQKRFLEIKHGVVLLPKESSSS